MVVIGGSIVALMALARGAPPPTGPLPTVGPTASLASDGVVPPATAGITFPDFAVDTEVVRSPTTSTAQSKLWFAQGKWWGALFGPTTNRLGIFALDPATHVWADTGTLIDERPIADADVLWDGTHLYVVSGGSRPSENHAIRMRRFTYDAGTQAVCDGSRLPGHHPAHGCQPCRPREGLDRRRCGSPTRPTTRSG